MAEEKVQTGYSRWSSSTENVQLTIEDDKRPACVKRMTWKRWIIALVSAAVLALVLGFIFGYLTKRAYSVKDKECHSSTTTQSSSYQKYTDDSYEELSALINTQSIIEYITDYESMDHIYYPGSAAANNSLHQLNAYCSSFDLTLSSISFDQVLLSRPVSTSYTVSGAKNYVDEVSKTIPDTLKPFVAYTHPGASVTGPPVYVSYGHKANFSTDVNYTGTICYMKYGQVNPFNMITNADEQGCVGVVLYPDPEEFPSLKPEDAIIANGKSIYGDAQTPGFPSITENTYKLSLDDVTGRYIPPNIPVMSASQKMVTPALESLLTLDSKQAVRAPSFLSLGYLSRSAANDTNVTLQVTNKFSAETVTRSVCATRGSIDPDKYVLVGTHHDVAGSGNVNPATGQAIMREMIKLIADNPDVYRGRRSIIFLSTDSSTLNIAHHEFVEENLREHGERMVAFVALTGTLSQGSYLQVKSSPPVKSLVTDIISNFPVNARHRGIEGTHSYNTYYSNLAVPVIEMSFSDKNSTGGVDSLPVCCDATSPNTDEERVKLAAQIHLQTIMKLTGAPILPYYPLELAELYADGLLMVQKHEDLVKPELINDLETIYGQLNFLLTRLNRTIVRNMDVIVDNLGLRRLNDALTGVTRSCILPQGVPMIDPLDNTKVIRNLNNRNLLYGSISSNDYNMVAFPGLYELFTASADPKSPEISNEISKHLTEILASMVDAGDYSRRAIFDPSLSSQ